MPLLVERSTAPAPTDNRPRKLAPLRGRREIRIYSAPCNFARPHRLEPTAPPVNLPAVPVGIYTASCNSCPASRAGIYRAQCNLLPSNTLRRAARAHISRAESNIVLNLENIVFQKTLCFQRFARHLAELCTTNAHGSDYLRLVTFHLRRFLHPLRLPQGLHQKAP